MIEPLISDAKRCVGMIHQPHFLPWPGYLARCLAADVVVLLDTVRFNKGYFHNRTKYIALDRRAVWLTLPVASASRCGPIRTVQVSKDFGVKRWQRRFCEAYRGTPLFADIWPPLATAISERAPSLLQINVFCLRYLIDLVCGVLGRVPPKIVLASSLDLSEDRTGRLMDIVAQMRMTHLLMGADAMSAHDLPRLEEAGVTLLRHMHRSAAPDAALGDGPPMAGVTSLHYLFTEQIAQMAAALVFDWQSLSSVEETLTYAEGKQ
jgi:hypothetical protein